MVDPVAVQLLRGKVAALVEEMHDRFYRSGYSTIVRESRDFSCAVLDRAGGLIVAPPMFFHAPVYKRLVGRVLEIYGERGLRAGDVFVCNHPYEGGLPHVSDMAFVAPVFAGGALLGFSGSIAHKADLGGVVPGSTSATATEIYQEGLLLPPVRIHDRGAPDEELERLILANSREPALVQGDMRAQIAATRLGADGLKALGDRFGGETVATAFDALLRAAARALGDRIRALDDGTATAEGFMDDDGVELGRPVRFAVTVTIEDGVACFDLSGSDRQARGPVNLRPSMVEACCFYALIACLGPDLAYNDGMREVARFRYGPRTVVNADPPAPVSSYQKANLRLVDVVLEALARFRPERAIAHSGSTGSIAIAWRGGGLQYEILSSAYGAGPGHDGASAVATHLSNLRIAPIEILESEFPCRISEFAPITDSGGAGEYRGGLSFRRRYELLRDAVVTRRYDRARFPPEGLAGGRPGRASRFVLRPGGADEQTAPASGRYALEAGESFVLECAGGGGYGDPRRRDPGALAQDLAEGYVSAEAARAIYGAEAPVRESAPKGGATDAAGGR